MKPKLDQDIIIQEAIKKLPYPTRRLFVKRALTLGGLSLLTGCSVIDEDSAEIMLMKISRLNDDFQALLFDPNKLAPTYPESMITKPFPFNAYYARDKIPKINGDEFLLEVGGLVTDKRRWSLSQLYQLPQIDQVTRHICVEGWSAIGKWGGVSFAHFLKLIGADLTAKYVGFKCADDYYTSIDMPTALHSQTILTFSYNGNVLPPEYGYPMKLRMPTKLGYKNPKHIMALFVTNNYPGGYWEDRGYNWFGGS
jgi:DMSO/TMAO reductase YedYZ molybdopterin-dependent catalytic subunit